MGPNPHFPMSLLIFGEKQHFPMVSLTFSFSFAKTTPKRSVGADANFQAKLGFSLSFVMKSTLHGWICEAGFSEVWAGIGHSDTFPCIRVLTSNWSAWTPLPGLFQRRTTCIMRYNNSCVTTTYGIYEL